MIGIDMVGRPISPDSIDDAFAKILIEELAHRDRVGDIGDLPLDISETASQRWETIAALEVPMETNGNHAANASVRPTIRPVISPEDEGPLPLEALPATSEPQSTGGKKPFWELVVTYPDGRQCTLPLEDKPITIGREKGNAIVLMCEKVSRRHARIVFDDRGPRVDDLGSVNGVLVNGIKVPAAYLKSGDVVRIGTVKIVLKRVD